MKRRNFIKRLCATCIVGGIVPVAASRLGNKSFTVSFSHGYWHDFWKKRYIVATTPEGHSISFLHNNMFDGEISKIAYEVIDANYQERAIYLKKKDNMIELNYGDGEKLWVDRDEYIRRVRFYAEQETKMWNHWNNRD